MLEGPLSRSSPATSRRGTARIMPLSDLTALCRSNAATLSFDLRPRSKDRCRGYSTSRFMMRMPAMSSKRYLATRTDRHLMSAAGKVAGARERAPASAATRVSILPRKPGNRPALESLGMLHTQRDAAWKSLHL
jgi:hypothetical protein